MLLAAMLSIIDTQMPEWHEEEERRGEDEHAAI